jgi:peptide/nickel transport system substrate-binding protein
VQFHDGKTLTAADVVYSLMRHKDPATGSKVKPVAEQFAEIKASGPYEVQLRLIGPNADLPTMLAVSHFLIEPGAGVPYVAQSAALVAQLIGPA